MSVRNFLILLTKTQIHSGYTTNANLFNSQAVAKSKLIMCIRAVVIPQPWQLTPKNLVHKHGMRISIPVTTFRATDNRKYPITTDKILCSDRYPSTVLAIRNHVAICILEVASKQHDEINECPKTTSYKSYKLNNSNPSMLSVKSMNT